MRDEEVYMRLGEMRAERERLSGKPEPPTQMDGQTQKTLTERLDQIESRANAATPGPWTEDWGRVRDGECRSICCVPDQLDWDIEPWVSNKPFIAAARSDVPALVKALRRAIDAIDHECSLTFAKSAKESISQLLREPVDSTKDL